jgi:MFS family permease
LRTVLIGLLNGVAGAILGFIGGDLATRAHNVSNFEGGRAMGIVFLIVPASAIAAAVIGVVVALKVPAPGMGGFARAQGIALLLAIVIAAAVFGYVIWRAPVLPTIDGRTLNLEFEVRMPEGRTVPGPDDGFTVLMTSRGSGDDRHHAELRLDSAGTSAGRVVIPARGLLYTSKTQRFLVVNDTGGKSYWFDLPLRAKPRAEDQQWTEWWPAPGQSATRDITGNGGFQIRYRVRKVSPDDGDLRP